MFSQYEVGKEGEGGLTRLDGSETSGFLDETID
jgi:hypothetical protein